MTNYDVIQVALAALRVAIAAVVKHEPTLKHKRDKLETIEEARLEQRNITPIFDRYKFLQMVDQLEIGYRLKIRSTNAQLKLT